MKLYPYRGVFWALFGLLVLLIGRPQFGWVSLVGFLVLWVLGFLIRTQSRSFIGEHTRLHVLDVPRLETSGPYRNSRNPLYVSNLFIVGAWLQFWPWWVFLFGGFLGIAFYSKIIVEEESYLKEVFGEEYLEYQVEVPRWGFYQTIRGLFGSVEQGFLYAFWRDRWTWIWQFLLFVLVAVLC